MADLIITTGDPAPPLPQGGAGGFENDLVEALGRYPGEGRMARNALMDYALMDRRSLSALCRRYREMDSKPPTRRLARLKTWSVKYEWQARIAQFDLVLYERRMAEWDVRRREVNERDWEDGQRIREEVQARLKTCEKTEGGTLQYARLVRSLREASELQRLATHEPTQVVDLSGSALDEFIERQLARITDPRKAGAGDSAGEDAKAGD